MKLIWNLVVRLLLPLILSTFVCGGVTLAFPSTVINLTSSIPVAGPYVAKFMSTLAQDTGRTLQALPDTPQEINSLSTLVQSGANFAQTNFTDVGVWILAIGLIVILFVSWKPKQILSWAWNGIKGLVDNKLELQDIITIVLIIAVVVYGIFVWNYGVLEFLSQNIPLLGVFAFLLLAFAFRKVLEKWMLQTALFGVVVVIALMLIGVFLGLNNNAQIVSDIRTSYPIPFLYTVVGWGLLLSGALNATQLATLGFVMLVIVGFLANRALNSGQEE